MLPRFNAVFNNNILLLIQRSNSLTVDLWYKGVGVMPLVSSYPNNLCIPVGANQEQKRDWWEFQPGRDISWSHAVTLVSSWDQLVSCWVPTCSGELMFFPSPLLLRGRPWNPLPIPFLLLMALPTRSGGSMCKFFIGRSSQTRRDTKLALLDILLAMCLNYAISKEQLPSSTRSGSRSRGPQSKKKPAAY